MFSLKKELKQIDDLFIKAMQYVDEGEFRKARRVLKPTKNSYCTTESVRASTIVYAQIAKKQGKYDEAINIVKSNIGYLWNSIEGLIILNCKNPNVNEKTKLIDVEVYGGTACLGAFTCFPENFKTFFQVLVQSEEEIQGRILELGIYSHPQNMEINILKVQDLPQELIDLNQGVIRTFPFEKYKEDDFEDNSNFEEDFDFAQLV